MYNLLTLNKIAQCGLKDFKNDKYTVSDDCKNPDCIMLRSFNMKEMELPESLMAVARAGAGVNNIPLDKCAEKGIPVFNTPGANANAVKELTITGMLLSCRDVVAGSNWAQTLKGTEGVEKAVEKGKSAFAGIEIQGKKLAVIGLGAIGVMVANAAYMLGMEVVGYDPFISVKSALVLTRHASVANDFKSAVADADFVTMHLPLNNDTKEMFNDEKFSMMKDGVRVLNFSRSALVDTEALRRAIENKKVARYITDFPTEDVLTLENTICIPHLGASTKEAEDNCAVMASHELREYMENGNIINSVNLPNCEMPREAKTRITVIHKNIPNMISQFTSVMSSAGVNIEHLTNKSNKEYGYSMMDTDNEVADDLIEKISGIDGVIRARKID